MGLQEQLIEDMKVAMKAGDKVRLNTVRMIRAQIKDEQIAKGDALTEDEEISVLINAAKKRKEAIEHYEKSERKDLLEKEKRELEIISNYLPKQLTEEEVEKIVAQVIDEVGAETLRDIGKVMSAAMKQLKGKADGKLVQDMVRKKLS
ncbi:MAG: GatB/YqeY domain-containing protein [bacterium]